MMGHLTEAGGRPLKADQKAALYPPRSLQEGDVVEIVSTACAAP